MTRPELLVAAWIATLVACSDPPAPVAPAPREPPVAAPRGVAGPAAFDLVATHDGVLLVWGPAVSDGAGVRALALDALGTPKGAEVVVEADGGETAEELVVASGGGRVGIAWLVRRGPSDVVVRGTLGSTDAQTLAPIEEYGASVETPGVLRGRVTLVASEDGASTLTFRTTPAPCRATDGTCARYTTRRLGDPQRAPRGIEMMEVRSPCDPLLTGAAWTSGSGYHGVCNAESGAPTLRIFAFRPEISYASFIDGQRGCAPVGLVAQADGAVGLVQCDDGLTAIRLGLDGRVQLTTRHAQREVTCAQDAPILWVRGDAGDLGTPLAGPANRIEAQLPESVARRGARAVWTGEAILVADVRAGEVRVARHACRLGALMRTDGP